MKTPAKKEKTHRLVYVSDETYKALKALKADVPGHTQLYVNDKIIHLGVDAARKNLRAAGFEPTAKAA